MALLTTQPDEVDICITQHGSITLVVPLTPEAEAWIEENVAGETTWFGDALVVEPRYLPRLVDGMASAGLLIDGGC